MKRQYFEIWVADIASFGILKNHLSTIEFLNKTILNIEKQVLAQVKLKKEFSLLQTIPWLGKILALTIMLEVGDISRFKKEKGNFFQGEVFFLLTGLLMGDPEVDYQNTPIKQYSKLVKYPVI